MNTRLLQQLGLFCDDTGTYTATHTASMTNDLNLQRLLQGKRDCWRIPKINTTLAKKKIVISEELRHVDMDEIVSILTLWHQLLDEGFELYAWTGELTPIKNSNDLTSILPTIKRATSTELNAKLIEKNIAADQAFIATQARHKMLEEYLVMRPKNPTYSKYEWARSDFDELVASAATNELIVVDVYLKDLINYYKNDMSECQLLEKYVKQHGEFNLIYVPNYLDDKQLALIPRIISDSVIAIKMSRNDSYQNLSKLTTCFPNVKRLRTSTLENCDTTQKADIINQMAQLNNLTINSSIKKLMKSLENVNPERWQQLECILFQHPDISKDEFLYLINQTRQLRYLDLSHCGSFWTQVIDDIHPNILQHLEYIVFPAMEEVTDEYVTAQLKWAEKCPKLRLNTQIPLYQIQPEQIEDAINRHALSTLSLHPSIKMNGLDHLTTQYLNANSINAMQLAAICNASELLVLTLIQPDLANIAQQMNDGALSKLIELKLVISCDCPELGYLLNECPRLVYLDLEIDNKLENKFAIQLNEHALSQLQILVINQLHGFLDKDDFTTILNHASKLKNLKLSMGNINDLCEKKLYPSYFEDIKINYSVKTLTITDSYIDVVTPCLNKHPMLEQLSIKNCSAHWENPQHIAPPALQQLRTLILDKTNINNAYLAHILNTATLLDKLDIHLPLSDIDAGLLKLLNPDAYVRLLKLASELIEYVNEKQSSQQLTDANSQTDGNVNTPDSTHSFVKKKSHVASIDAPNKNGNIISRQIFYYKPGTEKPLINYYREDIFTDLSIAENRFDILKTTQTFKALDEKPQMFEAEAIESYYQQRESDPNLYLGKMLIDFDSNDPQPLVGLTQQDKLIGIAINPPDAFDITYSVDDHLYYLKPKNNNHQMYSVSYLLEVNEPLFTNEHTQNIIDTNKNIDEKDIEALRQIQFDAHGHYDASEEIKHIRAYPREQRIQLLIAFTLGFEDEVLKENPVNPREIFNAIIQQRRGVCRHRAIAFKALAHVLGIDEVNIVQNCSHAFVEVKHGDQWITHDLGGGEPNHIYDVTLPPLSIKEQEKTSTTAQETQVQTPIVSEAAILNNRYRTWDTLKTSATTYKEYAKDLIKAGQSLPDGSQNILCLLNGQQFETMHNTLCQELQQQQKRSFYINDLDDINEHSFKIDNETGECARIDSPLIQFLKTAKRGDALIVNWSNFQSHHIGYNSITDAVRMLKNVPIPEGVTVVSLLPSNQMMGEDFYSRQRIKSFCPTGLTTTMSTLPVAVASLTQAQSQLPKIDFYDDHWEADFTGQLHVHGDKYAFANSALITAIEKNLEGIVLHNAPWDDETFRIYLTEIMTKGELIVNGKSYTLPKNFQFIRYDHPYSFSNVKHVINHHGFSDGALHHHIVNRATISLLFKRYHCDNHKINELPGLIEEFKNKKLLLYVTETLSDRQWAHIFMVAEKYGVALEIVTALDVTVPLAMKQHQTFKVYDMDSESMPCGVEPKVVYTNDIHLCMMALEEGIEIPVNEETTYDELMETIHIHTQQDKNEFTHQQGMLAKLLSDNSKKIYLRGRLSPILAKQLESLFSQTPYYTINGERHYPACSELYLVTDQMPNMATATFEEADYTQDYRWEVLEKQYPDAKCEMLKNVCDEYAKLTHSPPFNFIQLQTMLMHLVKFPNSNPLKQILRLNKDYISQKHHIETAWKTYHQKIKENATDEADVMVKRKDKLLDHLKTSPYTFVLGPSGVGKTTFIQSELTKTYGDNLALFTGMDKIEQWAKSHKAQNVLFIDEANLLAPGGLERFETLFQVPPRMLIDGRIVPVSSKHKVIFAGNFGHFEGRQQHRIFAERGNIITFKELPDGFLKSKIIEPIAKDLGLADVADRFIAAYHYLNKLMPDKHPVTARNLQMMVLRCFQHQRRLNNSDVAAALAIYDELSGMLNKQQRQALQQWLHESYKVDIKKARETLKQQTTLKSDEFFITKKRLNPVRILNDLFDIRDVKIAKALHATGTSGILFEGEAGEGKSRMAVAFLKARHMLPADPNKDNNKDRYYTIAPSDPEIMKKQLTKTFHEGAVVVIDEINTIPGIEELLNALLSGYDLSGKAAQNPGFFVIGTQNPVTYMKRKPLSDALLNRFQKVDLKPYSEADLLEIKEKLIQDSKEAKQQLDEYLSAKQYARQRHLSPQPTPRDFFAGVKSEKAKEVSDHKNEQTPVPATKVTLAQVVAMVPSIFKESAPVQISESKLVEIYRNKDGYLTLTFQSGSAYEAFVKEMSKEVLDNLATCSALHHSIYFDTEIIKYHQSNMPFMKNSYMTLAFDNAEVAKQFKSLVFGDQDQIKVIQKDNTLIINEVYDKEDNPILLQHDKSKKITFNMSEKLQQLVDDVHILHKPS